MIFLRYESFRQYLRFYPVNSFILFVNLLLFVIVLLSGGTHPINLIYFGAMTNVIEDPGMWRLVASMFLHGGFDHLLFNMFALFVFAPPMERLLGKGKYLALYFGSGLAGNVITEWFYSTSMDPYVSVGASGAIYGLFAAYMFLIVFRRGVLDLQSKRTIQMILGIGLIYSFIVPNINLYAHGGGFAGGMGLSFIFFRRSLWR